MSMPGSITSNTRYHVHTHFSVAPRIPGLANIENRLQRVNRLINAVGRSFAVITAGVGLRRLAGAFIGIHTEIEDARSGLAGLMTAITGMPAPVALERAAKTVENLRKSAARLPGELPQYLQATQIIFGPTARAGGTMSQAEKLAELAVVAGYSLGKGPLGARTLPLDVAQALTQGIGSYTTKDLNILLGRVDPKYAQSDVFNALSFSKRLEVVTEALENMQEAGKLLGMTMTAQMATLKDNTREIGRQASGMLYQEVKTDLIEINKLIESNADSIERWAFTIDQKLTAAYLRLKLVALNPANQAFAANVGLSTAGGIVGRQAGTALMMRQLAAGIPGAGLIVNLFTLIGAAFGNIASKYPGEISKLTTAFGRLGAAIGKLLGEIVRFLVANPMAEAMMLNLIRSMTDLADSTTILVGALGGLMEKVNEFIDMIPEFPKTESPLAGIKWWLEGLSAAPFTPAFGRSALLNRRYGGTSAMLPGRDSSGLARLENFMDGATTDVDKILKDLLPPTSEYDERDLKGVGDTNLNGPITIVIKAEKVDNPDLVARSFREVAERMAEYRRGGRANLVGKP